MPPEVAKPLALLLAALALAGCAAKGSYAEGQWARAQCNNIVDAEARKKCIERVDNEYERRP